MNSRPVPLVRSFSLVPKTEADSDEQELLDIWNGRKRTGWNELEEMFRCVILAEAGAGKSHEMEARAKHAEECGRTAFFIRIEDLKDDFEGSFEVGSADAFDYWLESQDEAWFFLDSIDEARLESPRAFGKAIKHFARRIKNAQHRAHIFISSRPYAWRARSDRDLLEQHLPFAKSKAENTSDEERNPAETVQPESALQVYRLDPLGETDIRIFAKHRETPNVDRLIIDLRRANLMSLAGRPFDLDGILAKWKVDQTLAGRLELLQHNIGLHLIEIDPDREQRWLLNPEKARNGARLLAAAVILTGEAGIRVPEATHSENGIDAKSVLGDWDPREVQALLELGIFNDVLYGVVRFRHREVRDLLAAEWFREHLKSGNSRHAMESLFFREQYGHKVITPRLRPILPWLILFDDEIRRQAIGIAPEVAVEGGDAAHLPFAERQALLEIIVDRIVKDEDNRSARDNSAIARIAQADLMDDVLRLIAKHQDNDDAIFFLGRLVWQGEMTGCVPALSQIATNPARGIYARIAATRAVITCGARDQKEDLWRNLIDNPEPLPRRLFAEIVENSEPDADSVSLLLASIMKLTAYDPFEATGASRAIHDFIDRLLIQKTTNKIDTLSRIVSGLNRLLDQEPHIERGECSVSEDNVWLLGPAAHSVEHLISVRSKEAFAPDALAIINKVPEMRRWRGDHFDEYNNHLHELVPAWFELNDTLFWQHVEKVRARLAVEKSERLIDDWPVLWDARYWGFGAERFRDVLGFVENCTFEDDKLIALSLAYRLAVQPNSPSSWLVDIKQTVLGHLALEERLDALLNPIISQSVRELQERKETRSKKRNEEKAERANKRAEWIAYLRANPDVVRHPPALKLGEFSHDQYWLLREIEGNGLRISRSGGAEWRTLCTEFGENVARAYRDAAVAHWRIYKPELRSEGGDTGSIPYALIFAMAGLEIEAREVDGFPFHLSLEEIRHALRYIVWELNGFPAWLETMHCAYPSVVLDAVLKELRWELGNADQGKLTYYILHHLVYHAPWLHKPLVEPILKWMEGTDVLNQNVLRYCIQIVAGGDADTEILATLAQFKITLDASPEQLAAWYALWIDVDAENAIPRLEEWLSSLQPDVASRAAQFFITELMGGRRTDKIRKCYGNYRNTENLKSLYILMHRYIQAKDDIERAGKGADSPGLRDDAQDARDALFKLLSEIPGKATYVALSELARIHPELNYRPWMGRRAYQRAEEDADLESWSAQQVREFDQHQVRTPTIHRQLFDLTIDRLVDLKNWLESGNDSPYKTWQRVDGETEMRNLVAGWLNHRSFGRYCCAQENELANSQRPDIWTQCAGVASPVPIELKLLDRDWSGPVLCERLRNQLAGDYLREETAGCGVMLLIWQGISTRSHWEIEGRRVELLELKDALKGYWNTIADNFPGVAAIEVILIDLSVRGEKSAT
jgi:hypothetical protein